MYKVGFLVTRQMFIVGFLMMRLYKVDFLKTGPMFNVGFLVIWPICILAVKPII